MRGVEIDRRVFVSGIGAGLFSWIHPARAERLQRREMLFASAYQDRNGKHGFAIFDENASIIVQHTLPARGHGIASTAENRQNVIFARRPGSFAIAFATSGNIKPQLFRSPSNRHFYGHGIFSPDGALLYATENDFELGEGKIGVYEAANNFRRIGEFPSYGTGPHDLALLADGKMLCVANGGIRTHPDHGRAKLNLDAMRPNISLIDRADGSLKARFELPEPFHRLSLRHMAVDRYGAIWIGGQFEGDAMMTSPLIARLAPDRSIELIHLPDTVTASLRNYIGSVCTGGDGRQVAFTSPKGGQMIVLDTSGGNLLRSEPIPRVCGLAGMRDGFVTSSETGRLNTATHKLHWDNHIGNLS